MKLKGTKTVTSREEFEIDPMSALSAVLEQVRNKHNVSSRWEQDKGDFYIEYDYGRGSPHKEYVHPRPTDKQIQIYQMCNEIYNFVLKELR